MIGETDNPRPETTENPDVQHDESSDQCEIRRGRRTARRQRITLDAPQTAPANSAFGTISKPEAST